MSKGLNSLPNKEFLDWTKFKAFAVDKLNIARMTISVSTMFGKGENAGYQHFPLFPQYFQKTPSSRSLKVGVE